jgi:hypothetical protein
MVVRCYTEDAEGPTDDPPKTLEERARWEGIVSTKLEYVAEDVKEIKSDLGVIKKRLLPSKPILVTSRSPWGKRLLPSKPILVT